MFFRNLTLFRFSPAVAEDLNRLDEALAEGRLKEGQLAVLSGFGAGLAWGTAVIRW